MHSATDALPLQAFGRNRTRRYHNKKNAPEWLSRCHPEPNLIRKQKHQNWGVPSERRTDASGRPTLWTDALRGRTQHTQQTSSTGCEKWSPGGRTCANSPLSEPPTTVKWRLPSVAVERTVSRRLCRQWGCALLSGRAFSIISQGSGRLHRRRPRVKSERVECRPRVFWVSDVRSLLRHWPTTLQLGFVGAFQSPCYLSTTDAPAPNQRRPHLFTVSLTNKC